MAIIWCKLIGHCNLGFILEILQKSNHTFSSRVSGSVHKAKAWPLTIRSGSNSRIVTICAGNIICRLAFFILSKISLQFLKIVFLGTAPCTLYYLGVYHPTGPFLIFNPRDQQISGFYSVQESRGADFETSKLWKGRSGDSGFLEWWLHLRKYDSLKCDNIHWRFALYQFEKASVESDMDKLS